MKIFAINGSPRMKKGDTELILKPFLQGIKDAGSETEKYYATTLDIKHAVADISIAGITILEIALLMMTCRYYIQN